MNHSFNVEIANKYGLAEAIIISNFAFWVQHSKTNDVKYFEGRYWTFNSYAALAQVFPYWSDDQIYRRIKSMVERKILVVGHFPHEFLDRTNWYSFADEFIEANPEYDCTKRTPAHSAKSRNASGEIAEPFREIAECSIYTDIKPDERRARARTREEGSTSHPPATNDKSRRSPQYLLYLQHFGEEDAASLQPYSRDQLTLCTDLELLEELFVLWRSNGWKHTNVGTIVQRYKDEVKRRASKPAGSDGASGPLPEWAAPRLNVQAPRRDIPVDPLFRGQLGDEPEARS